MSIYRVIVEGPGFKVKSSFSHALDAFAWSSFGFWNRVSDAFSVPMLEGAPEKCVFTNLGCVGKWIRSRELNSAPESRRASLYSDKVIEMPRLAIDILLFYSRLTGHFVAAVHARHRERTTSASETRVFNCASVRTILHPRLSEITRTHLLVPCINLICMPIWTGHAGMIHSQTICATSIILRDKGNQNYKKDQIWSTS